MNYCPVCKREYKQMSVNKTRRCPTCGSMLVRISDDELDHIRQKKD